MKENSFWRDFVIYVSRVREFKKLDWGVYLVWVGLMLGLFFSVSLFIGSAISADAPIPSYVKIMPIGALIFVLAIAIDTIGHRTIYKEVLKKGEALVHHLTIFSGITSVVFLCLGFEHRQLSYYPALVLIFLSIVYSLVDEILHWHRYLNKNSDRVEMWSHFFILTGHLLLVIPWWTWFSTGYQGVSQTLQYLRG